MELFFGLTYGVLQPKIQFGKLSTQIAIIRTNKKVASY